MYSNVMDENKPIFTTASETLATSTTQDSFAPEGRGLAGPPMENIFSPLAPTFRPRSEMSNLMHQEPRAGDLAPPGPQVEDELLANFRSSDMLFDDADHAHSTLFMGNSLGGGQRTESVSSNLWGEGSGASVSSTRHDDAIDTFDFLAKSISSANSYVSMLTREQLAVLRSFRPSLLYEFLQEIAKLRSDKRLRRAAPNECAFCKNNGENEECYSSHSLKDWRGRVLCPVLRAFRCPRCGATGDRAHTIKYCPDQADHGLDRSGSFARRRNMASSSLLFGQQQQQSATTPSTAPTTPSFGNLGVWNPFNIN